MAVDSGNGMTRGTSSGPSFSLAWDGSSNANDFLLLLADAKEKVGLPVMTLAPPTTSYHGCPSGETIKNVELDIRRMLRTTIS